MTPLKRRALEWLRVPARPRASGLGDPDEDPTALSRDRDATVDRDLRGAAAALLAEARRLRSSVGVDG